MPDTQTISTALAAITGPENTRLEAETLHLTPTTIDQLSAILRYANQHSLAIHPTGNNTKPWGHPTRTPIKIHTTNLNQIKEHIWQDMTATVQAGATWSSLQSTLLQHKQHVALDPLWPNRATVGGVIATNDSGALRQRYGSLRDLIIGMTIVLVDGTIAKSGGKVVKNVAGYDLHKLMTGAFGTLGIIAEVTFRLHALPANARSFTIHANQAEPLGALLLQITASQLSLQSLQLRTLPHTFALDISLDTMPSVLAQQQAELERMAATHGLHIEDAASDTWQAREAIFNTAPFVIKAAMLPTSIAHFSNAIRNLSGTAVTQAGGIMTAALQSAEAVLTLRREFASANGHLTLLKQPTPATIPIWSTSPNTLPLMQKIKHQFDPNRILNPGCFLDDI